MEGLQAGLVTADIVLWIHRIHNEGLPIQGTLAIRLGSGALACHQMLVLNSGQNQIDRKLSFPTTVLERKQQESQLFGESVCSTMCKVKFYYGNAHSTECRIDIYPQMQDSTSHHQFQARLGFKDRLDLLVTFELIKFQLQGDTSVSSTIHCESRTNPQALTPLFDSTDMSGQLEGEDNLLVDNFETFNKSGVNAESVKNGKHLRSLEQSKSRKSDVGDRQPKITDFHQCGNNSFENLHAERKHYINTVIQLNRASRQLLCENDRLLDYIENTKNKQKSLQKILSNANYLHRTVTHDQIPTTNSNPQHKPFVYSSEKDQNNGPNEFEGEKQYSSYESMPDKEIPYRVQRQKSLKSSHNYRQVMGIITGLRKQNSRLLTVVALYVQLQGKNVAAVISKGHQVEQLEEKIQNNRNFVQTFADSIPQLEQNIAALFNIYIPKLRTQVKGLEVRLESEKGYATMLQETVNQSQAMLIKEREQHLNADRDWKTKIQRLEGTLVALAKERDEIRELGRQWQDQVSDCLAQQVSTLNSVQEINLELNNERQRREAIEANHIADQQIKTNLQEQLLQQQSSTMALERQIQCQINDIEHLQSKLQQSEKSLRHAQRQIDRQNRNQACEIKKNNTRSQTMVQSEQTVFIRSSKSRMRNITHCSNTIMMPVQVNSSTSRNRQAKNLSNQARSSLQDSNQGRNINDRSPEDVESKCETIQIFPTIESQGKYTQEALQTIEEDRSRECHCHERLNLSQVEPSTRLKTNYQNAQQQIVQQQSVILQLQDQLCDLMQRHEELKQFQIDEQNYHAHITSNEQAISEQKLMQLAEQLHRSQMNYLELSGRYDRSATNQLDLQILSSSDEPTDISAKAERLQQNYQSQIQRQNRIITPLNCEGSTIIYQQPSRMMIRRKSLEKQNQNQSQSNHPSTDRGLKEVLWRLVTDVRLMSQVQAQQDDQLILLMETRSILLNLIETLRNEFALQRDRQTDIGQTIATVRITRLKLMDTVGQTVLKQVDRVDADTQTDYLQVETSPLKQTITKETQTAQNLTTFIEIQTFIKVAKGKYKTTEKELDKLHSKCLDYESQFHNCKEKVSESQFTITTLAWEINKLRESQESLKETISDLSDKAKYSSRKADVDALRIKASDEQLKEFQQRLLQYEEKEQILLKECQESKANTDDLAIELHSLQVSNEAQEEVITQLTETIKSREIELDETSKKIENIEASLTDQIKQKAEMSRKYDLAQKSLEAATQEISNLKVQHSASIEEMQKVIQQNNMNITQLTSDLNEIQYQFHTAKTERDELMLQVSDVEARLSDIKINIRKAGGEKLLNKVWIEAT